MSINRGKERQGWVAVVLAPHPTPRWARRERASFGDFCCLELFLGASETKKIRIYPGEREREGGREEHGKRKKQRERGEAGREEKKLIF